MFFKDTSQEYTEIIEDISISELSGRVGVKPPITGNDTLTERWTQYAYLDYMRVDDDIVYASTFAYFVGLTMTGMGLSAGAEYQYFKESLFDRVLKIREMIKQRVYNETDQKREFYKELKQFFMKKEDIVRYELAIHQYGISVNAENKRLLTMHGGLKQYIVTLLGNYDPAWIPRSNTGDLIKLTFKLTYTQDKLFEEVEGKTGTEKVLKLLGGIKD